VADYAQRRIVELLDSVQPPDLRVVSPTIRSEWSTSQWSDVLPDLPEERRVEAFADPFFDDLARAWIQALLQRLEQLRSDVNDAVGPRLVEFEAALSNRSAVELIRWCRATVAAPASGETAVLAPGTANAAVALASLAAQEQTTPSVPRRACCKIGEREIEVLVVEDLPTASTVRREAERRTEALAWPTSSGELATFRSWWSGPRSGR